MKDIHSPEGRIERRCWKPLGNYQVTAIKRNENFVPTYFGIKNSCKGILMKHCLILFILIEKNYEILREIAELQPIPKF